jgi:cell division protein FtsB
LREEVLGWILPICRIVLIAVVLVYFAFHAIGGANGLLSYLEVKRRIVEVVAGVESVRDDLAALQIDVGLLGKGMIDIDMLEERCRAILGYSYPGEVVMKSDSVSS